MASIEYLKKFDPAQLFRFFVDGRFQKSSKYNGWIGYDAREPGSVQAMLNGFSYMLDNLHAPQGVTALYLCNLHRVCMFNVRTGNLKGSPGEIRYEKSGLPFFKKTTSYENIVEFVNDRRSDDSPMFFDAELSDKPARLLDAAKVFDLLQKKGKLTYRAWMPSQSAIDTRALQGKSSLHAYYQARYAVQMQVVEKMEALVAQYHRQIGEAESFDEKLGAIAWLVRELEILHPFSDGNCRVFACVLLNQLLLCQDMYPSLLLNPNHDFERSYSQWIDEIKKGMSCAQQLLENPDATVYEYSRTEMSDDQRQRFLDMGKEFTRKITDYSELFLTPECLQRYTRGRWVTPAPSGLRYKGVTTHNSAQEGSLYFAASVSDWKTNKKNVWDELQKRVDKNIRSMVIDDAEYAYGWDIPVFLVDDVMQAFMEIAGGNRRESNPLTVLITGTEGKTGSKIQLHHVLKNQAHVHARLDSGNTVIPIFGSLISLDKHDKVEINEVSVDADTDKTIYRSKTINPDICFFSNISAEHMHVHQSMEGVMANKAAVVAGLKSDGKCILNSSMPAFDDFLTVLRQRKPGVSILTFGYEADDTARLLTQNLDSEKLGWNITADIAGDIVDYFLPLFQHHAPIMSVGVLLAVKALGYDVRKAANDFIGIQAFESMGSVYSIAKDQGTFLFYDQSRRSSISGVRSVFKDIENLTVKGKVVALFGSVSSVKMNEWTDSYHRELADLINGSCISRLYTTGPNMDIVYEQLDNKSLLVKHSDDFDDLYKSIMRDLGPDDVLVIQGYYRLNLADIAGRVINYNPAENLSDESVLLGLENNRNTRYSALLFLKDVEDGVNADVSRRVHKLTAADVRVLKDSDMNFRNYRGRLLTQFFSDLDTVLPSQWGIHCINDAIKRSGMPMVIHNPSFCERWFNNLDKIAGLPKKQLFGSFYDFGDSKFILHVMAGSTNLHIGLVKYSKKEHKYITEKMDSDDVAAVLERYGRPLPKSLKMEERRWGFGWTTIDCGEFIDSCQPEVFSALYAVEHSEFFATFFKPLLGLLKPAQIHEK